MGGWEEGEGWEGAQPTIQHCLKAGKATKSSYIAPIPHHKAKEESS